MKINQSVGQERTDNFTNNRTFVKDTNFNQHPCRLPIERSA